jgi:FkbM family methyltransferase
MAIFRRLTSAVKGALWLVRGDGLRGRLEQVEERLAARTVHLEACLRDLDSRVKMLSASAPLVEGLGRTRAHVLGHTLYLDPADQVVGPTLLRDGIFEPLETELVEREIGEGDVVLDMGANIGYYTLLFARLVGPQGRVFAFEPDPGNFRLLRRNVSLNGYHNAVLVHKAVSDRTGPLRLYVSKDNKGDHRIYDSQDGRRSVEIEATTLDDALADFEGRVTFIKMDIQGAEAHALRGMGRLLERLPAVKMVVEFWPIGLRRCGADPETYLHNLLQLGFKLWNIDEERQELRPTTPAELLAAYLPEKENYTNLFCVRG